MDFMDVSRSLNNDPVHACQVTLGGVVTGLSGPAVTQTLVFPFAKDTAKVNQLLTCMNLVHSVEPMPGTDMVQACVPVVRASLGTLTETAATDPHCVRAAVLLATHRRPTSPPATDSGPVRPLAATLDVNLRPRCERTFYSAERFAPGSGRSRGPGEAAPAEVPTPASGEVPATSSVAGEGPVVLADRGTRSPPWSSAATDTWLVWCPWNGRVATVTATDLDLTVPALQALLQEVAQANLVHPLGTVPTSVSTKQLQDLCTCLEVAQGRGGTLSQVCQRVQLFCKALDVPLAVAAEGPGSGPEPQMPDTSSVDHLIRTFVNTDGIYKGALTGTDMCDALMAHVPLVRLLVEEDPAKRRVFEQRVVQALAQRQN